MTTRYTAEQMIQFAPRAVRRDKVQSKNTIDWIRAMNIMLVDGKQWMWPAAGKVFTKRGPFWEAS